MAKITYVPRHEGDPQEVTWNKHRFKAHEPCEVADDAVVHLEKGRKPISMVALARGNPHFTVGSEDASKRSSSHRARKSE